MRVRLVGFAVLLALVAAPEASAAISSTFVSGTLTVNGDESGEEIKLACVGNKVLLNGINPPSGELACEGGAGTLGKFIVNGNGGNDVIDVSGVKEDKGLGDSSADGGAGDDQVTGYAIPSAPDEVTILGGPGNDLLIPNEGEIAFGGSGDDRFQGLTQVNGQMNGELGSDTAIIDFTGVPAGAGFTFAPLNTGFMLALSPLSNTIPWASIEVVDLTLNDFPQTVDGRGFAGTMIVRARDGADTIYGTEAADVLDAGAGNDFIEGLGGADTYQGGAGFDRIEARDGIADGGDCGSDADTLVADPIDALIGCELIELPPAGPDKIKPKLKLKRAVLGAKKLRLTVACPKTETRCSGILTLAATGKLGKAKKKVNLGPVAFSLAGGKSKTISRAVGAPKRELLRELSGPKLQVRLDVTDAAGNRKRGRAQIDLTT